MKLILVLIMSLSSAAFAENQCSCLPTTGKDYIGAARKKSAFGFSIHWICDYECRSGSGGQQLIKGTYKKFYPTKTENGLEGICEGMKYEPHFNIQRNDYVYMWDGKTRSFNPKRSKSTELKQWAESNDCQ